MRRGPHDGRWRNDNPEMWNNHNPRIPHGNRRPDYHGYMPRPPPIQRHWGPDPPYRQRPPAWRGSSQHIQQGPYNASGHNPRPMYSGSHTPNHFTWTNQQCDPPKQMFPSPHSDNYGYEQEYTKPKEKEVPHTIIDKNLHDTIDTVKRKLRERKASEDFVEDGVLSDNAVEGPGPVKASEKRRIEHSKLPPKVPAKKNDKKDTAGGKYKNSNVSQPSSEKLYQRKSQIMRRKILQQLFKMDKNNLRQMLTAPGCYTKYDFALRSLIKDTRNILSSELRSIAENSLQFHRTTANSVQGEKIVQDAFMGHLGTMLDTSASLELSNMEPQVIAELSRVLQQDLMGSMSDELSVSSLANAMHEPIVDDSFSNSSDHQSYYDEDLRQNHDRFQMPVKTENNSNPEGLHAFDNHNTWRGYSEQPEEIKSEFHPEHVADQYYDSQTYNVQPVMAASSSGFESNKGYSSAMNSSLLINKISVKSIDSLMTPSSSQRQYTNDTDYRIHQSDAAQFVQSEPYASSLDSYTSTLNDNNEFETNYQEKTNLLSSMTDNPVIETVNSGYSSEHPDNVLQIQQYEQLQSNFNVPCDKVVSEQHNEITVSKARLESLERCNIDTNVNKSQSREEYINDNLSRNKLGTPENDAHNKYPKMESTVKSPSKVKNQGQYVGDMKSVCNNLEQPQHISNELEEKIIVPLPKTTNTDQYVHNTSHCLTRKRKISEAPVTNNNSYPEERREPQKKDHLFDNTVKYQRTDKKIDAFTETLKTDLISAGSQTNEVSVKSKGTQYYAGKSCDSSTQVYESLISSRTKGTQFVRQHFRNSSTQTLKVEGISRLNESMADTAISKETQTDELHLPNSLENTRGKNKNDHAVELSKTSNKTEKKTVVLTIYSKQDEIMDRMKQIDNDIQLLIQERLKLYSILETGGSISPSSSVDSHKARKSGTRLGTSANSSVRNHEKSPFKYQISRNDNSSINSAKHVRSNYCQKSSDRNIKAQSEDKQIILNKKTHKTYTSVSSQKHKDSHSKSERLTTSTSVEKKKEKTKPNHNLRRIVEIKNIGNKIYIQDGIVGNTDFSISDKSPSTEDALKLINENNKILQEKIRNNNHAPEGKNLNETHESSYFNSTGHPVSFDCNFVASEEVVIDSDSDDVCRDSSRQSNLKPVTRSHNKNDLLKNERKIVRKISKNDNESKSDKNLENLVDKNQLYHRPLPNIRFQKKNSLSVINKVDKGPSPLLNLVSELDDLDEISDAEFVNPQTSNKFNVQMNEHDPSPVDNLRKKKTPLLLQSDKRIRKTSTSLSKVDLTPCSVVLQRLDLVQPDIDNGENTDPITNLDNEFPLTQYSPPDVVNDSFFSFKDYDNDDYCISLDQIPDVQFGHLDDPDSHNIIDNIGENINLIENWDSKLFENITLTEDRDVLLDKTLSPEASSVIKSENLSVDQVDDKSINFEQNISEHQADIREQKNNEKINAITFTDHNDSIIAIECIGNKFLAASLDGNVYFYCWKKGVLERVMEVSHLAVTCLYVKREKTSNIVYTGSLDSNLQCFNFMTGEKIFSDMNVGSPIQSMCQAWNTLYIGTRTGFVVKFDLKTNSFDVNSAIKFSDNTILALHAIKEGPRKVLLIASRSQQVTVKDATTGLLLRTLNGSNTTVYSLLFESGNVFCGTSGKDVQVFDFPTGDLVNIHTGGIGAVCLKIYRGLLFTGCYDGMIYVFKLNKSETPIACIPGPGKMLLAMTIVNNKIIAGCNDKSLSVWTLPDEVIKNMIH